MPELRFHVESSEAVPHSAVPLIALKLRVTNSPENEQVRAITLKCQIQIEPVRRRYEADEQVLLHDLFGEPERWGKSVHPLLWMNTSVAVPSFSGNTLVDIQIPCTFDFNVASTKYFHALKAGDIPLGILFSGTVFYHDADDQLQISQIPWSCETKYSLSVSIWKRMMDAHYPNSAWLVLQRDAFEKLYSYKVQHGLPTWEHVLNKLLPAPESALQTGAKA